MDNYQLEGAEAPEAIRIAGHGNDYFVATAFFESMLAGDAPPIWAHEAMDMTLPGLATLKSLHNGSEWTRWRCASREARWPDPGPITTG